jgi:hypothetical protein
MYHFAVVRMRHSQARKTGVSPIPRMQDTELPAQPLR